MNDGLRDVIQRAFADCAQKHEGITIAYHSGARQIVEDAVRAWLALPPSEEEIEAAARAICLARPFAGRQVPCSQCVKSATVALVTSRAVLVRPPEVEKGTS